MSNEAVICIFRTPVICCASRFIVSWNPYTRFCSSLGTHFRGFVLSGLRRVGHKWWAIGLSSVAFGLVHPILQQQIAAAAVGMVLGYLAVQTGSLLVCMVFHAVYNGLAVAVAQVSEQASSSAAHSYSSWIFSGKDQFQPWVLVVSVAGTAAILWWLHRLPYQHNKEEQLQEARERQFAGA